jgi:hypothetical protein
MWLQKPKIAAFLLVGGRMPQDIEGLFRAEKMLAAQPAWVQRDSDCLEIVCSVEIDGVVKEGLFFRLTARKSMPDEMVTAQIEFHPPGEAGGPLARIEWKPLSSHNNRGLGPKEYRHRLIEGCHHHAFESNLKFAEIEIRKGRLPVALPLRESPADFDALLDLVSKEFRITNIHWIEAPPWEPLLV